MISLHAFCDLDAFMLKISLSMVNSRTTKHFRFLSSVWAGACVASTSVGRTIWIPKRMPNCGFRPLQCGRLNLVELCSRLYGVKICLKAKSEQPATKQSQIIWWNLVVKIFTDSSKILEKKTNVEQQNYFLRLSTNLLSESSKWCS